MLGSGTEKGRDGKLRSITTIPVEDTWGSASRGHFTSARSRGLAHADENPEFPPLGKGAAPGDGGSSPPGTLGGPLRQALTEAATRDEAAGLSLPHTPILGKPAHPRRSLSCAGPTQG